MKSHLDEATVFVDYAGPGAPCIYKVLAAERMVWSQKTLHTRRGVKTTYYHRITSAPRIRAILARFGAARAREQGDPPQAAPRPEADQAVRTPK